VLIEMLEDALDWVILRFYTEDGVTSWQIMGGICTYFSFQVTSPTLRGALDLADAEINRYDEGEGDETQV